MHTLLVWIHQMRIIFQITFRIQNTCQCLFTYPSALRIIYIHILYLYGYEVALKRIATADKEILQHHYSLQYLY